MKVKIMLLVVLISTVSFGQNQPLINNTFPSAGNVGIGTLMPKAKLDVLGKIQARNISLVGTSNPYAPLLSIGSLIESGNDKRTFNFYHRPMSQSNLGYNSYAGLEIADENNIERFRYDMVSNYYSAILLRRKDGSEAIKISEGTEHGDYIHMPHSNSRIVIGGWGSDFPGNNLIVRSGNTRLEENVYVGKSMGIGTNNFFDGSTLYKLSVKGKIRAEEVKVYTTWADYVFDDSYTLKPLEEVEHFIVEHGHLPNVPSGAAIEEGGLNLGEISKIQQEKIEELTLYIIELNKELKQLRKDVDSKSVKL